MVRFEVWSAPGADDPRAASLARAAELGGGVEVERVLVYLVCGPLTDGACDRLAEQLLSHPITQQWCWTRFGGTPRGPAAHRTEGLKGSVTVEVHPLPGVMDPAAASVQAAARVLVGETVDVQTGLRFDFRGVGKDLARAAIERTAANPVVHAVVQGRHHPRAFPRGRAQPIQMRDVPVRHLDDLALEKLSRDAHLFLSLDEMRAIQEEFRRQGRDPREIELETIAQTWSEHCVHKTLKSTIRYRGARCGIHERPGHEEFAGGANGEERGDTVLIRNLLKTTVAAATHELIGRQPLLPGPGVREDVAPIDWCLSVFVDNSGVIAFDDLHAVCFKVETHNHPSAIEPYGGAATGIGGCIRDVIGTGQGAKPIAATDVFCVAHPDLGAVPRGCIPPRRVLTQVVAGIRDYGNRMGIPTLNGAVWFDDRHVGNPLVFAGCVGLMPRSRTHGGAQEGDAIVVIGGRTGRDGIHGATFSSAELTDTHADEFSHAVQIGNAITEKCALDAILAARDHAGGPLFHGLTDCGAGGFSSAVGEMGGTIGAEVHLDRAPLKYEGLSPTEVWISEAQERMVLAVPEANLPALEAICIVHDAEMCRLGTFGTADRSIRLLWNGVEVGRLDTAFLHGGIPMPERDAVWDAEWCAAESGLSSSCAVRSAPVRSMHEGLEALLQHPNIASKAWIIRQYDHEVQGMSVVKPLQGIGGGGPGDGAVIAPVSGSMRGLAMGNGLATGLARDPYVMGLAAIDECVRNLVCVGADPQRIAILDNFCWPSCKDARNLGALVRAAWACYDGAKAFRTPFISGKDSLNNQFVTDDGRTIQIPPTLLISGFGIVPDVRRCCTMDLKRAGRVIVLVGSTSGLLGGSHWSLVAGLDAKDRLPMPQVDLARAPVVAATVARAIAGGAVHSAHDCSEGGLLVAAAEMAFAGGLGLDLDLGAVPVVAAVQTVDTKVADTALAFGEDPSRYLLEMDERDAQALCAECASIGIAAAVVGCVTAAARMVVRRGAEHVMEADLDALRAAWERGALETPQLRGDAAARGGAA